MATKQLQLSEENIYASGYIIELPDGRSLLKRDKTTYIPSAANDRVHRLKELQKIWDLAGKYYGSSKWHHIICDVNAITNPFELPVGVDLIIPDIGPIKAAR